MAHGQVDDLLSVVESYPAPVRRCRSTTMKKQQILAWESCNRGCDGLSGRGSATEKADVLSHHRPNFRRCRGVREKSAHARRRHRRTRSIHRVTGRIDFVLEGEGKTLPVSYIGNDHCQILLWTNPQALVEGHPQRGRPICRRGVKLNALPSMRQHREAPVELQQVRPSEPACSAPDRRGEAGHHGYIRIFCTCLSVVCAVYDVWRGIRRFSRAIRC